jgi:hypothetical protein
MNRRVIALLIVLAVSVQGPSLAYAAVATATMPAACHDHLPANGGNDSSSCCPQGLLPGACCSGGLVLAGSAPLALMPLPVRLPPIAARSVPMATERPAPLLRPPIA